MKSLRSHQHCRARPKKILRWDDGGEGGGGGGGWKMLVHGISTYCFLIENIGLTLFMTLVKQIKKILKKCTSVDHNYLDAP